jgi:hypothetical protein
MKAKEHGSGNATPRKRVRRGIEGWRTLILQQRASGEARGRVLGGARHPAQQFQQVA